jgi:hypothetical protein
VGMVAGQRRIGSAFFVVCGNYGDVSRFAKEQCISRQWVYREAKQLVRALDPTPVQQQNERLQGEVAALQNQVAELHQELARAVILDDEKQAEFASVGQACGVSLPKCHLLLDVLIPGQVLSVPTLGRRTQAVAQKAGALLEVFDDYARPLVRDGAADEIYVKAPVLMVVEQASLCWVCGRLSEEVTGEVWKQEFSKLPNLQQLARDGGMALAKGVALVNAQREEQRQELVVDQGDHFHALWQGGKGVAQAERQARKALAEAEAADKAVKECARQGRAQTVPASRAYHAWKRAEQAMDAWQQSERAWQQTKDALPLITPAGEVNTRAKAEAVLAQSLPQLEGSHFAKTKRQLQEPEILNYLDRVQAQLAQMPFAPEVTQAAVQQEALRRRRELLTGDSPQAGVLRGVMLMCAVVLAGAGQEGQQAVTAVREIFRRAYRASSLVECINSVLRMQQNQHRKMTQGLLDLKRLYWNSHTFRTGRRRGTTPYQRLGVPWPEGMRWWDVLKLTPEQLRDKLSTARKAA